MPEPVPAFVVPPFRSSRRRALHWGANVELIGVPQRVGIQNSGMEITHARVRNRKNVGRRQKDERKMLGNQLLHAVVELLSLSVVESDHLLLHELIDFAFPWAGGLRFVQMPQVRCAARGPD